MKYLDIIVPVKNERENIVSLIKRIDTAMHSASIEYTAIFIDDNSDDGTFELLLKLKQDFPLEVLRKKGKSGKAFSILEGVKVAKGEYLAMIDGDLQYPPEKIPEMFEKLADSGVVVAKRGSYETSFIRRSASRLFGFGFGKLLFNFDTDVQSGLKLFKKEVIEYISEKDVSPWTLDLPLLLAAREMGYKISEVEIDFGKRTKGESKISFLKASAELGLHSLKTKLSRRKVYKLSSKLSDSMVGAGVAHRGKRFITHTTLGPERSAIHTLTFSQKLFMYGVLGLIGFGLIMNSLLTIQAVIAILSFVYFIDVLFNFFLIFKSLHFPPEITISEQQLSSIKDLELPTYSILCPLYKEASVLPHFLDAISKIEWPKEKLDVLLLLEEDDEETIEKASQMELPGYVRTIIVPNSNPKTKPKACNYGLSFAKGEYLVVYDAEDIPDPLQLKKAYLAFKKVGSKVICLQAKLNYHNPHQNFLTRLFTAEYSLWFDVILTGLQSIETTIPLGGTSNHFRTKDLVTLEGWDPFNVTEDCDLGVRLFQNGYKTAIIDSTTLEEANSRFGNWVRQRSRWIKGYMQTYLVHMRNPVELYKKQGFHAFIFQLLVGGKIAFMFINPFLWITTIAYFSFRSIVGPSIEALYPPYVFYMAAFSLVFGNFLFLYYYMIGCAKREQWSLIKYVYFVPIYWLAVSWAACIALYQLIFKPHYWEKTVHGLHLKKLQNAAYEFTADMVPQQVIKSSHEIKAVEQPPYKKGFKLAGLLENKKLYFGASMLVFAIVFSNVCNFLFNAYLGRVLTLEEFGDLSLFTSLLYLSSIPLGALGATITQKVAYLYGKYTKREARGYLQYMVFRSFVSALVLVTLWLLVIPFLTDFFKLRSLFPLWIFTPVWILGVFGANFGGFLKGIHSFGAVAISAVLESIAKLIFVYLLVDYGQADLVYLAIPLSLFIGIAIDIIYSLRVKGVKVQIAESKFNKSFFTASLLGGLTNVTFLTLDVILVKHFLSPFEAGQYGLLALVGKITFFLGSLFGPFMLPLVAKNEGAKTDSRQTFLFLFGTTTLFSLLAFVSLGIFGERVVPLLFGAKTLSILPLLPLYVLAIMLFTIAQPVVSYFQAKQNYAFVAASFLAAVLEVILISFFHRNLEQVIWMILTVSLVNLGLLGAVYFIDKNYRVHIVNFIQALVLLFKPVQRFGVSDKKNILIFNWYDIKHVWAGGAEFYIHNIAKRFVDKGHKVTIFCGNDGHSKPFEIIDGIRIYRRGGLYSVAVWGFIYYILRFRGKFDVIIDNAKGVPFFTPYYARKPVIGLIHHIHQEMFRTGLKTPLRQISMYLEGTLMPRVYKNTSMVTVSESSMNAMHGIGLGLNFPIRIVNPGVEIQKVSTKKTLHPSVIFLGRLRFYKRVDILIEAIAKVKEKKNNIKLLIVGQGEDRERLIEFAKTLGISDCVEFIGKVNEEKKAKLFSSSWMAVQPSLAEGWGITVIEANACGTPVIASDVDGLKDSVIHGKTGILLPVPNAESFSSAILKLVEDRKLLEKLSTEALAWSQEFSWDKCADKFLEILEHEIERQKSESRDNLNYGKVVLSE